VFKKSQDKASPARIAPPTAATAHPKGSKPELLAMMPSSLLTSPGVIAGIVAFELVYGLLLAGVMSTRKRPEPEVEYVYVEDLKPSALAHNTGPMLPPKPEASPGDKKPEKKPKADGSKAGGDSAAKGDAAKTGDQAAGGTAEKPKKKPPQKKKKAPAKKKEEEQDISQLVAATTTAPVAPPANAPPKVQATLDPLGALVDPSQDCQTSLEGGTFTVKIPAKLHALSKVGDKMLTNAPRALTEVNGDFSAEVKVTGAIKPGTKTIAKDITFTYQGAGLLLWQDPNNYLRLERGVGWTKETGSKTPMIFVENYRDGKPGVPINQPVRDADVMLRIARRKGEITCSYSFDGGKTWLDVKKRASLGFDDKVSVGISATNVSKNEFPAQFEDFVLNRNPGKAG
jgi:regulation of enolase protein 1 (concanavalin A-like superfamily)